MKLVTYRLSGAEHVGALTADGKGVLPLFPICKKFSHQR